MRQMPKRKYQKCEGFSMEN